MTTSRKEPTLGDLDSIDLSDRQVTAHRSMMERARALFAKKTEATLEGIAERISDVDDISVVDAMESAAITAANKAAAVARGAKRTSARADALESAIVGGTPERKAETMASRHRHHIDRQVPDIDHYLATGKARGVVAVFAPLLEASVASGKLTISRSEFADVIRAMPGYRPAPTNTDPVRNDKEGFLTLLAHPAKGFSFLEPIKEGRSNIAWTITPTGVKAIKTAITARGAK